MLKLVNPLRRLSRGQTRSKDATKAALACVGQVTTEEVEALFKLASEVPRGHPIVELGSYQGRSTIALAFGSKHGQGNRVYAIDPHLPYVGPKGGVYGPKDLEALYRNIVDHGMAEIVAVVCLPSESAALGWASAPVGLLWIDGNHRYDAVKADVDGWFPRLSADAIVAFHDSQDADVRRVIDESISAGMMTYVGSVHSMTWLRRR